MPDWNKKMNGHWETVEITLPYLRQRIKFSATNVGTDANADWYFQAQVCVTLTFLGEKFYSWVRVRSALFPRLTDAKEHAESLFEEWNRHNRDEIYDPLLKKSIKERLEEKLEKRHDQS